MELVVVIGIVVAAVLTLAIFRSPWKSEGSGNPDDWCGPPPRDPDAAPEPWLTERLRQLLRWRPWP